MGFKHQGYKCSLCRGSEGVRSLGVKKYICQSCDTPENIMKFEEHIYRTTMIHTSKRHRELNEPRVRPWIDYLKRKVI